MCRVGDVLTPGRLLLLQLFPFNTSQHFIEHCECREGLSSSFLFLFVFSSSFSLLFFLFLLFLFPSVLSHHLEIESCWFSLNSNSVLWALDQFVCFIVVRH